MYCHFFSKTVLGGSRVVLLSVILLSMSCLLQAEDATLRLVVARSINSTTIVDSLLADFAILHPEIRIELRSVGSLQAHEIARRAEADVVMSHYPPGEERLLNDGIVKNLIQFMTSEYAIFGPPGDELGLLQETNVGDVLRKLAANESPFIAPSPLGGTYLKLNELWASINVIPDWQWYEQTNTTPLGTLRIAAEQEAFALANMGSYIRHQNELSQDLVPLFRGGFQLRNPFSVMTVNADKVAGVINSDAAEIFVDYIISDRGQAVIYQVNEGLLRSPIFFPTAHLDPGLIARRATDKLERANRTLLLVSSLLAILFFTFMVALYLAYRARQSRLEQMDAEIARTVAEQANQAKSDFLSSMSHELRTPMNSIMGFAQLLDMNEQDPIKKDNMNEILKASDHLLALINDMLDLSKIEARRISIKLESVKLDKVVDACLQMADAVIKQNEISVQSSGKLSYTIKADPVRIKEVLLNLISNAAKFNRHGGSISIHAEPVGERLRVAVIDTGEGLSEDQLRLLFQPFERLDAVSKRIEGSGLGLVISKNLIRLMGGDIGVESQPGVGSTFWIEIDLDSNMP